METFFTTVALGSTAIFAIQIFCMVVFGGIDALDIDFDVDPGGEGAFKVLSFQTIVIFMLMFGWSGITFLDWGLPIPYIFLLSSLTGLLSMFGFAWLISLLPRLDSGNLKPTRFVNGLPQVGATGSAYQNISPGLRGSIMVGGEKFTAVNLDGETIRAFEQIKVEKVYESYVGIKKA